MKKSISIFVCLVTICISLNAQRSDKSESENPRESRQIAITSESGFKSLTGVGLSLSYYATKKIALDAGLGIGFQGFKGGIRGRYLFLDKKFTPYVGASFMYFPTEINDTPFPSIEGRNDITIDVVKSPYGQLLVGFEYMGDRGFVIGFNLGYSRNFKDRAWSTEENISDIESDFIDFAFGSGISTGFNIGYAF